MLSDRTNKKPATPVLITSFINLMNQLTEVMAAEPALVIGRKFDEHAQLLKRKQKLTIEYRASLKSLLTQPDMFKQLPDETRRTLKTTAHKLSEVADRNSRMLGAAVVAMQRLVQNIIAYVRKEMLTKPGYKNPKTAHLELGKYSPTCKPVAVRQTA